MGDQRHLEPRRPKVADHRVVVAQVRRTWVPPRLHQADRPAVAGQDVVDRDRAPTHRAPPIVAGDRHLDLGPDEVDDAVEELVLVGEVVVDRHRLDAELLAELAHAEGLEAALIGDSEGGLQDELTRQGDARANSLRGGTLRRVRCLRHLGRVLLWCRSRGSGVDSSYFTPYGSSCWLYSVQYTRRR